MSVRDRATEAKRAGRRLAAADRPALLRAFADALRRPETQAAVLAANAADLDAARDTGAPVARLGLDAKKLAGLCQGLEELAALPDPLGRVTIDRELDEGLVLRRVTCPLGLVGVVFEARPDAVVQITGLAWKSGNAVVLKGGREAARSNAALVAVAREVLAAHGLPAAAVTLLEDRAEVEALLALDGVVDLLVARGSSALVEHLKRSSRIPVMGHAAGICHLYLHAAADPARAARIAVDAKTSYPAACNSVETLLWDPGATDALDACVAALLAAGVELRGDEATRARHPGLAVASAADWDTEHGALVLGVRQVAGLDEALAHIERHGSRHTEAIVTADPDAARRFLDEVDAAGVFHDASTRFADGYRYGLGAEVGISTDKLHARGPVGVDGLVTYRWLLEGSGQVSTSYGPGGRRFTHRDR